MNGVIKMPQQALAEIQQSQPSNRFIPVPKWKDYHPEWPTEGGLRHLIFHKDSNGFASAFKKVWLNILIDEQEFFNCIDRKNQGGK